MRSTTTINLCMAARRQDDKCACKYNGLAATVNATNIADGSELS